MRKFQIVMFVIVMTVASTQTFRHVYVKWVEPTESVLDQFKTETESEIASARTIEELLTLYVDAKKAVEKYESDDSNPSIEMHNRASSEPYKSEFELKWEIEQRERQQKMLFKLYFYWFAGLLSIAMGILVYSKVNKWIGITGVLTGFLEMIFWTSPLNRYLPGSEFALLINSKLLLSVCTLALLVWLWLWSSKRISR